MKNVLPFFSLILLFVNFSCGNNASTTGTTNKDSAENKMEGMRNKMEEAKSKSPDTADVKKYDIKSGIITYETMLEISGMQLTTKKILYFDDYGAKECEEEYKTGAAGAKGKMHLTDRNFVKDGYHYIISIENKKGVKTRMEGTGVAVKFDMNEAAAMAENQVKKLDDETVCGKPCTGFSMVVSSGKMKMYGWNRIALKTIVESTTMKMKTETVATKIQENVAIPSNLFDIPSDIVIREN